jgi:CRP-like cAMP-binding protein
MSRLEWPLPEPDEWLACVRRQDRGFFRGLPNDELAALRAHARGMQLGKGDVLWERDATDGWFVWIWSGRVVVRRDEEVIDFMHEGDILGLSSIHDRPHTATVEAVVDSELVVWDGHEVRGVLESNPRALIAALGSVSELVGQLNTELLLMRGNARATQLVAWHVVRLARVTRLSRIDLPRAQLAARVGIAPRALYDALTALARERIIRLETPPGLDEGPIVLLDVERATAVYDGRLMLDSGVVRAG